MEELLSKLNELWNSSDDEIKEILDNLPDEQVEQLMSVFEDMVDEREFIEGYM